MPTDRAVGLSPAEPGRCLPSEASRCLPSEVGKNTMPGEGVDGPGRVHGSDRFTSQIFTSPVIGALRLRWYGRGRRRPHFCAPSRHARRLL